METFEAVAKGIKKLYDEVTLKAQVSEGITKRELTAEASGLLKSYNLLCFAMRESFGWEE